MGGGSQQNTTATTQQLTPEQQSLVSLATPQYQQFAASNPTLPTGAQAVAPFNAAQTAGQNAVLGATGIGGGGQFGGGGASGSWGGPTPTPQQWPTGAAGGNVGGTSSATPGSAVGSPNMGSTVGTAAGTNQYLSSGAFLDPGSNPYVQNAVSAATQPIFQDLSQRTLPNSRPPARRAPGLIMVVAGRGFRRG